MQPDPRVFFAAERTLLAWIRTAITLMALGFVVARFGLFLALLGAQSSGLAHGTAGHWLSAGVGVLLMVSSAGVQLLALRNHLHFIRTLPPGDLPDQPVRWLPVALSLLMVACALMLAAYVGLS
jgi:putative membrane protein